MHSTEGWWEELSHLVFEKEGREGGREGGERREGGREEGEKGEKACISVLTLFGVCMYVCIYLSIYLFIYLAALGLSCGMRDLF